MIIVFIVIIFYSHYFFMDLNIFHKLIFIYIKKYKRIILFHCFCSVSPDSVSF